MGVSIPKRLRRSMTTWYLSMVPQYGTSVGYLSMAPQYGTSVSWDGFSWAPIRREINNAYVAIQKLPPLICIKSIYILVHILVLFYVGCMVPFFVHCS